jgi:membrane fusion protein, multidrug efflux system
MKKYLFLTVYFFLVLLSCRPDPKDPGTPAPNFPPVRVAEVREQFVPVVIDIISNLLPWQETHLAPQSPGRINRIYVVEGARVKQGDLLVQMESTELEQSRVQIQLLQDETRRLDTLRRIGAVALQQYEQAAAQLEIARATHQRILQNTQIRAPFPGIISAKHYNEGEVFTMAPPAGGAPVILTITQLSPLKSVIDVSERFFPKMRQGMVATARSEVFADKAFEGTVSTIFPTVNPATRTFTVEIKLPNPEEQLRPGMSARIQLPLDTIASIAVPKAAILRMAGTNERMVFVVDGGIAYRRVIETGTEWDEIVEVISGLNEGEQIVISGQGRLQDGIEVQVAE